MVARPPPYLPPSLWPWTGWTPAWLVGTYCSVAAAALWVLGLALLKKTKERSGYAAAGVALLLSAGLGVIALVYAPDTTVTAAGQSQVVFCYMAATGVLGERYTAKDKALYVVIAGGGAAAAWAMPKATHREATRFPVDAFHSWLHQLTSNEGFLVYISAWVFLVFIFLAVHNLRVLVRFRRWTFPLLAGLFGALVQFVINILTTVVVYDIWSTPGASPFARWEILSIGVLALCLLMSSLHFTINGALCLDLRFFQPMAHSISTVLVVLQGLLFFREFDGMTGWDRFIFAIGSLVSVFAAIGIRPKHDTALSPATTPTSSFVTRSITELQRPERDRRGLVNRDKVLRVLVDHGLGGMATPPGCKEPEAEFGVWSDPSQLPVSGCWAVAVRMVPAVLILGMPTLILSLWLTGATRTAFSLLAFYFAFAGWRFGIHISIFALVGMTKLRIYDEADWGEIYIHQLPKRHPDLSRDKASVAWRSIRHFVIVPNYAEDLGVLREAVRSVADSSLAREQITLVLAMEAREARAEEKVQQLSAAYRGRFAEVIPTFHPEGLPGETPGKAANLRWAAQRVFDLCGGADAARTVLTVADADSNFHPRYFEALTYHFLAASPDQRGCTIWQPPIVHYRNYHTQPAVVRLASLITSQHELARLADPSARRLPYSTYSISLALARGVGGWDPDWISEDWHMCAKCHLATGGQLNVQPIFLPVINYAPEGESWASTVKARWVQAKRHALGVSELVYILARLPAVLKRSPKRRWRVCLDVLRLWAHMLAVHLVMATAVVHGPLNGFIAASIIRSGIASEQFPFSVVFAVNMVCAGAAALSLTFWCCTNVLLYSAVQDRIADAGRTARFSNPFAHFCIILSGSLIVSPSFFLLGAAAEWIAAVRTAVTHRFQYDVAPKPAGRPHMLDGGEDGSAAAPTTEATPLLPRTEL
eukprot:TRINITY_DN18306_c0_g1_i1.p1 TRINITY_DN18306_c0_g1~~TRINITY_DN18306_c0_g1_i1.p1  ORF type:complete len:959 (+),score=185.56 TRINITY_DN18306_c0_g1_i1:73-2877(+)